MSFLGINIFLDQGKFANHVYRKQTFSGNYTRFDSSLPSTYKVAMIYFLLYRFLQICSDMTKFHLKMVVLMDVLKNDGYPENFINNCFKSLLDNKRRIKEKVIIVPKKPLCLVHPHLGPPLSLQTITKFSKL